MYTSPSATFQTKENATENGFITTISIISIHNADAPVLKEYQISDTLMTYMPPFLLVISLVGNTTSFLVFSRPRMCNSSTSFYFRLLALADMYVILISLLPETLTALFSVDIVAISGWNCKIYKWMEYIGFETAAWLLVLVSAKRLFGIVFPLKAKHILTLRKAKIFCSLLVLIISMINTSILVTTDLTETVIHGTKTRLCSVTGSGIGVWYASNIFLWLGFLLHAILPFSLILIFNVGILISVVGAHFRRHSINSKREDQNSENLSSMAAMLLMTSFSYLVLTAPLCAFVLVSNWFYLYSGNLAFFAKVYLWQTVGKLLMFMNHSINVFVYYASGSRFRAEIKAMLTQK